MAQQNRGRRPRGRHNNQNRPKFINKNQAFDSSGPQGRVRGNAQQIYEKYQALARDAQAANEHTLAEAHFQHAEHYLRLYNDMLEQIEAQRAEKVKRDEERMQERDRRYRDDAGPEVGARDAPSEDVSDRDLGGAPQPRLLDADTRADPQPSVILSQQAEPESEPRVEGVAA